MEAQWAIEHWVCEQARTSTGAFYAAAPAKELDIEQKVVFSKLLSMVAEGKLEIEFEIRCPDCFVTVFRGTREEIPEKFSCDRCGSVYSTVEDDILPYFRFTQRFRDHVRNLKLKNIRRMIRAEVEDDLPGKPSLVSTCQ